MAAGIGVGEVAGQCPQALDAFGAPTGDRRQRPVVDQFAEFPGCEEVAPHAPVPRLQRIQAGDVGEVSFQDPRQLAVGMPGHWTGVGGCLLRDHQHAVVGHVAAKHRTCGNHRAVPGLDRPDCAALAAEEDGGLVEHDASGYVTEQGRGRLVAVRGEVEVDVGRTHLAVVGTARPARHQAVAEVDQAAQCDEREEDGLLESDTVRAA